MLGATGVAEQLDIPAATVCCHAPPGTWARHVQFQAAAHCSKVQKADTDAAGRLVLPSRKNTYLFHDVFKKVLFNMD
jgi:hypothetical protein